MKLVLEITQTRVEDSDRAERMWLSEYLTFKDTANSFRRRRGSTRTKYVDPPEIMLYNMLTDSFPAGLTRFMAKRAREEGFSVEIVDARPQAPPEDPKANLGWLRPYQHDAVMAASQKLTGIVASPTGSGKTEQMIGLTRIRPCKYMILVHRASIAHQLVKRFEERNQQHSSTATVGLYQSPEDHGTDILVSTFQKLRQDHHKDDFKEFAKTRIGLIVDECHVLPANSYSKVAECFTNARIRIGFSGTPLARGDKRSLIAVGTLGSIIYKIDSKELIDSGYLSEPVVTMVHHFQVLDQPTYQGVYGAGVVRSSSRNKILANIVEKASKPAIVFVKELSHGVNLMKHLSNLSLSSAFVRGTLAQAEREKIVSKINRGDLDVVVATVVWQEGIDIPNIESVVIGCSGKSVIAALQRVGRGMRLSSSGKGYFEVWDILDTGNEMLEKHSRARMKAYKTEGFKTVEIDPNAPVKKQLTL